MTEASDAAEQVVRMMLSGSEIAVRLTGSALKNGTAMLMALAKNHKKVSGKMHLTKMLSQTRDIRTFTMTPEQYELFKKKAKNMRILYSTIRDKHDRTAPIDIVLPATELDRANVIFEKIRFIPEKGQAQTEPNADRPQEQKKESRSEPDSHDTRDNSSMRSERTQKKNERPSVEQKLKDNKAALERKHSKAPTKQKTRKKSKGRSK